MAGPEGNDNQVAPQGQTELGRIGDGNQTGVGTGDAWTGALTETWGPRSTNTKEASGPDGNDGRKEGSASGKKDSDGLDDSERKLKETLGLKDGVDSDKVGEAFNEMMRNGLVKQREQIKRDNELIELLGLPPNASRAKLEEAYKEMVTNGLEKQREQVKWDNEFSAMLGLPPGASRAKIDEAYKEMVANGLETQQQQVKADNAVIDLLGLPRDAGREQINKAYEEMVAHGAAAYRDKHGTRERKGG